MPNLLKGLALKIWLPFSSLDPDLDIELNLELFLDLDFEMDLDFDLILDLDRETSSWPVFMLISRNNCFSVWHLQRWPRSSHYLWFYFCKLMFSLFLVSFLNCFSHDFASFLIVFSTILQFFLLFLGSFLIAQFRTCYFFNSCKQTEYWNMTWTAHVKMMCTFNVFKFKSSSFFIVLIIVICSLLINF